LGWTGHELQWRGSYEIPGRREPDIATIYQGTSISETQALLAAYGVDLVVVGPRERARYGVGGATVHKLDALFDRVYQNPSYIIFGRPR
jgi:uncharacterized membrane protein